MLSSSILLSLNSHQAYQLKTNKINNLTTLSKAEYEIALDGHFGHISKLKLKTVMNFQECTSIMSVHLNASFYKYAWGSKPRNRK